MRPTPSPTIYLIDRDVLTYSPFRSNLEFKFSVVTVFGLRFIQVTEEEYILLKLKSTIMNNSTVDIFQTSDLAERYRFKPFGIDKIIVTHFNNISLKIIKDFTHTLLDLRKD